LQGQQHVASGNSLQHGADIARSAFSRTVFWAGVSDIDLE
jgi:hypothetical protein